MIDDLLKELREGIREAEKSGFQMVIDELLEEYSVSAPLIQWLEKRKDEIFNRSTNHHQRRN